MKEHKTRQKQFLISLLGHQANPPKKLLSVGAPEPKAAQQWLSYISLFFLTCDIKQQMQPSKHRAHLLVIGNLYILNNQHQN